MRRQCELLGLSRSSLYYNSTQRDMAYNEQLMRRIDEEYTARPFYGVARMTVWLRRCGYQVNPKRVRRLMRQIGLEAIYPRRRRSLSQPDAQHKVYPYLLGDVEIVRPNQVWAADITYIRLWRGWVYLMAILDWFSRYVVAWELSITLEADFCVAALERALGLAEPEIVNTDQGSQFTSGGWTDLLVRAGVAISMDGKGRVFDNIFVERLWRTLKFEEVYLHEYETPAEARLGLGRYFAFYNYDRPHQGLGYRTPAEVYGDAAGSPVALRAPSEPPASMMVTNPPKNSLILV